MKKRTLNRAAQALGRMAKGHKKTMSPAALEARRRAIAGVNAERKRQAAARRAEGTLT